MDIKIAYDYKERLPDLVKQLTPTNRERLWELLNTINSGQQINPNGAAVIPFNARIEEMLIFLYEQILFYKTNIFFSPSDVCNEEQCFLDFSSGQKEVLSFLQKLLSSRKNDSNQDKYLLQINRASGKVIFRSPNDEVVEAIFSRNSNAFKVISYLAEKRNEWVKKSDLFALLNPLRQGANSDDKRRINDTIQQIRTKLKGNNNIEFIVAESSEYKLTSRVEFV